MGVEVGVGVAQDLDVDPPEGRVEARAGALDGLGEPFRVGEVREPARPGQVREPGDGGVVGQEDRVPGQELPVADRGESRVEAAYDGGVLAPVRAADAVAAPVGVDHSGTIAERAPGAGVLTLR
ncbi:hypothetical protein GCM10020254_41300 [Streptomyces goshikiensis]